MLINVVAFPILLTMTKKKKLENSVHFTTLEMPRKASIANKWEIIYAIIHISSELYRG